jgi:hypothetical protein
MDFNPYLLAKVQFISTSGNALNLDHNPELKPWQSPAPNNVAGKGQIEEPGQMKNIVVEGLNAHGFRRADGGAWSVAQFEAEMARLGA